MLDSVVYLIGDECVISKNSSGSLSGGDSLVTCFSFKSTAASTSILASDHGPASGRGKL